MKHLQFWSGRSESGEHPAARPTCPGSTGSTEWERQEGIEVENGMWGCVWSTQRGRECSLVSLSPLQLQFKQTLASIRLQLRYYLRTQNRPNGKYLSNNESKWQTNSVSPVSHDKPSFWTEFSRMVTVKSLITSTLRWAIIAEKVWKSEMEVKTYRIQKNNSAAFCQQQQHLC